MKRTSSGMATEIAKLAVALSLMRSPADCRRAHERRDTSADRWERLPGEGRGKWAREGGSGRVRRKAVLVLSDGCASGRTATKSAAVCAASAMTKGVFAKRFSMRSVHAQIT